MVYLLSVVCSNLRNLWELQKPKLKVEKKLAWQILLLCQAFYLSWKNG